jgi:hypothetical protein
MYETPCALTQGHCPALIHLSMKISPSPSVTALPFDICVQGGPKVTGQFLIANNF